MESPLGVGKCALLHIPIAGRCQRLVKAVVDSDFCLCGVLGKWALKCQHKWKTAHAHVCSLEFEWRSFALCELVLWCMSAETFPRNSKGPLLAAAAQRELIRVANWAASIIWAKFATFCKFYAAGEHTHWRSRVLHYTLGCDNPIIMHYFKCIKPWESACGNI